MEIQLTPPFEVITDPGKKLAYTSKYKYLEFRDTDGRRRRISSKQKTEREAKKHGG